MSLVQSKALALLPVTGPNTKQVLWMPRQQLGEATVDKPWARKDSFPPLAKYSSRRRTETKQINTRTLLMKLFTKNPSGYRPFQSSLYTRLIKSWCQQNTDQYGQHTNLTDNHGFWEIANWKWLTTDGVDLLFCVQVYKHRIQLTRLNAGRKRGQGWRTGQM